MCVCVCVCVCIGLALNALGGAMSYLTKLGLANSLLSLDNFHDLHGLGDEVYACLYVSL